MVVKVFIILFFLLSMILTACAPVTYQGSRETWDYPTGPGTIPPSWYDNDPAYGHWFSPWYSNPYRR
jgi:hypothetical protein